LISFQKKIKVKVKAKVKVKVEGKKGFSSHRLISIDPQPQNLSLDLGL